MAEKMLDSTLAGMTRRSSHLPPIYGNDSLELVWENGQILVRGGSSSATTKTPSCMGYSTNPSRGKEANDEDACIAKSARFDTLQSLLDFPLQRDSDLGSSHRNPHQSNDQNSSQLDLQFSKSKSKLKVGCADLRPATIGNGYLCTPSTRQCLPSASFKKPRIDSSQTPATNSQKQDLGKINFSNVLRPSLFLKSTNQGNSATKPTNSTVSARVEQIKASKVAKAAAAAASSKAPDHSVVIDSSKGSHGLTGLQGQTPLISDTSNPVSFVARSQESLPDEHSEAVDHKGAFSIPGFHGQHYNQTSSSAGLRAKHKVETNLCNEPLLESFSVCSLGASNNTNLCSTKHEDTDDSTHFSDHDEGPEDIVKEMPVRDGIRVKRSRNAEIHNSNERKRRDKINKKMRVLKELIPNCNKMDKASMLDDAIKYLKALKLQLQIMSMGRGLCMPVMMLPNAAHHMINTPHLPQLMGAGLGFRPGSGIPCSLLHFPIPSLPGITDNRVRMFGFPNQVPPMPMSHVPFIPMFGNPSTQPILATSTATKLAENLASAHLATLKASVPKNSYLDGQAEYATKQAPDQGTK